jgi:hypothetical protein
VFLLFRAIIVLQYKIANPNVKVNPPPFVASHFGIYIKTCHLLFFSMLVVRDIFRFHQSGNFKSEYQDVLLLRNSCVISQSHLICIFTEVSISIIALIKNTLLDFFFSSSSFHFRITGKNREKISGISFVCFDFTDFYCMQTSLAIASSSSWCRLSIAQFSLKWFMKLLLRVHLDEPQFHIAPKWCLELHFICNLHKKLREHF